MKKTDPDAQPEPMPAASDALLRALLLHRVGGEQAAALEQRLIIEDGLAERLRQIEYELLDAYARGQLPDADRAAVRQHLLRTPQDQHRLQVARLLAGLQLPARPALPRLLRGWPGRLALAGLAAALVLTVALRLPQHSTLPSAGPAVRAASGYTVSLLAEVSRGDAVEPIRIPPGIAEVRLQAELEQGDDAAVYELRVTDPDGRLLQLAQGLKLRHAGAHAFVEASVAASALGPGLRRIAVRPQSGNVPARSWTVDAGG